MFISFPLSIEFISYIFFYPFFDITIGKFLYIDMLASAVFGLINDKLQLLLSVHSLRFDSLELDFFVCSKRKWFLTRGTVRKLLEYRRLRERVGGKAVSSKGKRFSAYVSALT